MASIKKIQGKKGISYKISVYMGKSKKGKVQTKSMTWKPEPNMTVKQIEKELVKLSLSFEEEIKQGLTINERITFAKYSDIFMELNQPPTLALTTYQRYESLLERINDEIGKIPLNELNPTHLKMFYSKLARDDVKKQKIELWQKKALKS